MITAGLVCAGPVGIGGASRWRSLADPTGFSPCTSTGVESDRLDSSAITCTTTDDGVRCAATQSARPHWHTRRSALSARAPNASDRSWSSVRGSRVHTLPAIASSRRSSSSPSWALNTASTKHSPDPSWARVTSTCRERADPSERTTADGSNRSTQWSTAASDFAADCGPHPMISAATSTSTLAIASASTISRVRFTTDLTSRSEIAPEAKTSDTRGKRCRNAQASSSSLDATPSETLCAAATSAETAAQLSRHH